MYCVLGGKEGKDDVIFGCRVYDKLSQKCVGTIDLINDLKTDEFEILDDLEVKFYGNRFKRYNKDVNSYRVEILVKSDIDYYVDWIEKNLESAWGIYVIPYREITKTSNDMMVKVVFYFESFDDAVVMRFTHGVNLSSS